MTEVNVKPDNLQKDPNNSPDASIKPSQPTTHHFDVVISGGGLSGISMALSLSKLTKKDGSLLSIAIVEAQPVQTEVSKNPNANKNALFDARVLALSHGSASYLNALGAWKHLKEHACAITDIDISDRGHFGKARLTAKDHNVNALGYVVDMANIGKAQLTALNTTTHNISWFTPDSITDIDWQDPKQVNVTLHSEKTLTASLLLACDGVQSPVRKLANIKVTSDEYQQVALIANVSTSKAHHNKAYERFTEFGPIAMLPLNAVSGISSYAKSDLNESRCSLVWTMTPAQAKEITELNDEEFSVELERAFGSYLGAITHVGERFTYPLVLLQAQQQTYHRMALVGNSSHTIHPIAGQGFNLGLRDVKVLSELISKALSSDENIGSFALLHQYQANRAQDQREIIALTDSLVTLFSNDLTPMVIGRNIGLQSLNCFSAARNALVKKTMGY